LRATCQKYQSKLIELEGISQTYVPSGLYKHRRGNHKSQKMPASLQQRAESEDSAHLAIEGLPAIDFNSYLPTVACDIM
jgi:hypothetical protein